jgi:hypothetical protein
MTRHDVQAIANVFHRHVVQLEQGVSSGRGVPQRNMPLLSDLCDVVDALYVHVLRRRFPTLRLHHWHDACLTGARVFAKEDDDGQVFSRVTGAHVPGRPGAGRAAGPRDA